MKRLRRLFYRLWMGHDRDERPDETAKTLRALLAQCPGRESLNGAHEYRRFASMVLTGATEDRIASFHDALEEHDWDRACRSQEWDALSNNLEAFAVKCIDGRVVVMVVIDYYEPYYTNDLASCEIVSGNAAATLVEQTKDGTWRPL